MLTIELDRLGLERGATVLDLGCGEGRHVRATRLLPGVHGVALDLGREEVERTRDSLREMDRGPETAFAAHPEAGAWMVVRGDTYRLPFPDHSFDCVIASEILEHLHADDLALAEVDRVLKPGGCLAVSVPRYWPEAVCWALSSEYPNSPGGHVRIYRRSELRAKLHAHGFSIFAGHFAHGLHAPYWWLKCLFGLEARPNFLISAYHRMLVWEMFARPRVLRWLASVLDPLAGKSEVFYARKPLRA